MRRDTEKSPFVGYSLKLIEPFLYFSTFTVKPMKLLKIFMKIRVAQEISPPGLLGFLRFCFSIRALFPWHSLSCRDSCFGLWGQTAQEKNRFSGATLDPMSRFPVYRGQALRQEERSPVDSPDWRVVELPQREADLIIKGCAFDSH